MVYTLERHTGSDATETGTPVTISLHGGGGVPKTKNDRQWELQRNRYPDAPGLYVCPRAPVDTWDQWHPEQAEAFIDGLVQQLLIHEEIDPNRVYLMGYSAGGYGAFSLGANMADRFAAVASSAGAPVPDATPAEHWQNLPLRFEIGEKDTAYGRVQHCRAYDDILRRLSGPLPHDTFPFVFVEHSNLGHQIPDQPCALWLAEHRRNPRPSSLTWTPSASRRQQFYWLASDEPAPGQRVHAAIEGNRIHLETSHVRRLRVRLDDQLVDLDHPVSVYANGMKIFSGKVDRNLQCLVQTLEERGDPSYMFCSEIELYIP